MTNKRNYLLSLSSGMAANIISQLLAVISVPILLNYFGSDEYGALIVLNTFVSFLILSNFGVTEAAIILLSKENSIYNKISILKKSFIILMPFILGLIIVSTFIDTQSIIQLLMGDVDEKIMYDSIVSLKILFIFFILNSIFSLMDSYIISIQKLYVIKIFDSISSILIFISIIIIVFYLNGDLWNYFFSIGIVKIFIQLLKIIFVLYTFDKTKYINNSNTIYKYREIVTVSARTFLLSIVTIVVWSTDNVIISHLVGIEYVAEYSIIFKIFQVFNLINSLLVVSIIPIFAKHYGLNDWNWINDNYNKIIPVLSVLGGFSWIFGIFFTPLIINIWIGNDIHPLHNTIFFLGGYAYLLSIINLHASIAMAFNYLKISVWIGVLEAMSNLIFSILLVYVMHSYTGAAMGTFLSALIFPYFILLHLFPKLSGYMLPSKIKGTLYFFTRNILPFIILYFVIDNIFKSSELILAFIGVFAVLIYVIVSFLEIFKINNLDKNISFLAKIKLLKRKYSDSLK